MQWITLSFMYNRLFPGDGEFGVLSFDSRDTNYLKPRRIVVKTICISQPYDMSLSGLESELIAALSKQVNTQHSNLLHNF